MIIFINSLMFLIGAERIVDLFRFRHVQVVLYVSFILILFKNFVAILSSFNKEIDNALKILIRMTMNESWDENSGQ